MLVIVIVNWRGRKVLEHWIKYLNGKVDIEQGRSYVNKVDTKHGRSIVNKVDIK